MKLSQFMESTLITIPLILCTLLLWKLISSLRSSLPWRVNCWFCNSNIWVKYIYRNCWTCPKCEQYNGFTKDGDYNKALCTNTEQVSNSPRLFQRSPPKNGLCKMCNINQQLKVTQLANFVPMNEKKYDEEIDSYRPMQKILTSNEIIEELECNDNELVPDTIIQFSIRKIAPKGLQIRTREM